MDPGSYEVAERVSVESPHVIPAFGIHPWAAHRWAERLEDVDALIEEAPMIGEIGLDRRWVEEPEKYEPQRLVFRHFLRGAAASDRIITRHTSGAAAAGLEALIHHRSRR